ncbi:V-nitrogenase VFe protein subunit VnfG [Rhodoblastus acidophilus]|uniref:nitrogenase n=1 Tax=Rhodoblastus acidophilus TaxID=1074 RepID=A0A212RBG4_RHOAC|nr:V-containing nitrogenase subunit delta [Rhodoblastus acidophilus]MCW2317503.1 nitrogenase delta subunit [Rhodoblastus acidophilus]PPQ39403.1 V-containing nitrogenase subunit delta [Rhodoblastus acidophilus]RAI19423.1 V-containing nitrogenase subunit delta [Rhodoblastus acidophilus]SNB69581.1 V-nitrogenase VFe protein subunit VnfG [Rhodoblastus acidophilus]
MSEQQVKELFDYCQVRYLWQFFSRSWDREENIEGILNAANDMFRGRVIKKSTPMERLFYADAKEMVKDFRENFPWIEQTEPAKISELLDGLKAMLREYTITKSLNHELNHSLY